LWALKDGAAMFLLASLRNPWNETCHGANNMMEILDGASFEIAGAMIFACFLMIAWVGDEPDVMPCRVRELRK
jgi:hypothetical protein